MDIDLSQTDSIIPPIHILLNFSLVITLFEFTDDLKTTCLSYVTCASQTWKTVTVSGSANIRAFSSTSRLYVLVFISSVTILTVLLYGRVFNRSQDIGDVLFVIWIVSEGVISAQSF